MVYGPCSCTQHVRFADVSENLQLLGTHLNVDSCEVVRECHGADIYKAWVYSFKAKQQLLYLLHDVDQPQRVRECAEDYFYLACLHFGHNLALMGDFPKPAPDTLQQLREAFAITCGDKDLGNYIEDQRLSFYPRPKAESQPVQAPSEPVFKPLSELLSNTRKDIFLETKLELALVKAIQPPRYFQELGFKLVKLVQEREHSIHYFSCVDGTMFTLVKPPEKPYRLCLY